LIEAKNFLSLSVSSAMRAVAASVSSPRHVRLEKPLAKRQLQLQQHRIDRSGGELARRRRRPAPIAAGDPYDDDLDDDDFDADLDNPDFGKFAWDPVAEPRSPPPPPPPPFTTETPFAPPLGRSSSSGAPPFPPRPPPPFPSGPPPPSLAEELGEVRLLLAAAASAGLASAARAVSRALELLLSFVGWRRPTAGRAEVAPSKGNGKGAGAGGAALLAAAAAELPRPGEVARLTVAVVAASLALLCVVQVCDAVGRRLITETLLLAAKK